MGVTLAQALGTYTHGGAVAHGDDNVRGSLRPGKLADFTRLGADPFATELSLLPDIPVRGATIATTVVAESEAP